MQLSKALEGQRSGRISGPVLLRAVVEHPAWVLPAVFDDGGPRALELQSDDGRWLQAFQDATTLDAARAVEPALAGDSALSVSGADLVALLDDDTHAGLNIDPFLDGAIHYRRAQFPKLRRVAQAVALERLLLGQGPGELTDFLDYDGFHVVLQTGSAPAGIAMAPDSRGRKLAAVFTTEDAVMRFTGSGPQNGSHRVVEMSGPELFARLAQMPLDGLVFNCSGPHTKAVAAEFCGVVLASRGA